MKNSPCSAGYPHPTILQLLSRRLAGASGYQGNTHSQATAQNPVLFLTSSCDKLLPQNPRFLWWELRWLTHEARSKRACNKSKVSNACCSPPVSLTHLLGSAVGVALGDQSAFKHLQSSEQQGALLAKLSWGFLSWSALQHLSWKQFSPLGFPLHLPPPLNQ